MNGWKCVFLDLSPEGKLKWHYYLIEFHDMTGTQPEFHFEYTSEPK